jgi:5-deoxy-glucuronate isomerase
MSPRHLHASALAAGQWRAQVTPRTAGWDFAGLRIADLPPGGYLRFATDEEEAVVLPLSGSCRVECDAGSFDVGLAGRADVFAGPSDFAYLPRDCAATVRSAAGGQFAIATAPARRVLAPRYGAAADVPVELRGAGACSRLVRNFLMPDAFGADRLIACEVITPGGNWSSYPPHKHDEDRPGECVLEEIYYYEIAAGPGGPGFGYQRVYGTAERPADLLAEVRSGDVVLVPHGWHGPSMAAPGYDMYYLNVMAGPAAKRAWLACDDPAHTWVRADWRGQPPDPRISV